MGTDIDVQDGGDRMALSSEEALKQSDELYERYGKPLEAEHWGEFVAIAPDGRTVLGTDMDEVFFDACETLGEEFIQFKVGPKAVGRI